MVVEGLVFAVVTYVIYRKKSAKLARWIRAWGEVVEVKERRDSEGMTRHPVVRFKTLAGDDATFESKFGSSNWKIKAGDQIQVLFDPNNPSDAEVVGFMSQWVLCFAFGVISLTSLIGAPIVYLLMK